MQNNSSQATIQRIVKQLTQSVPYYSLKGYFGKIRQSEAKCQTIDYANAMFETVQALSSIQHQNHEMQLSQNQVISNKNLNGLPRRVSILRMKKYATTGVQRQSTLSKNRIHNTARANKKGLIKLNTEEEEDSTFVEFVEKLRMKKIKFAEAMGQFERVEKKQEIIKTSNKLPLCQRPFITNSQGEQLKFERRETKRDSSCLEKTKVKPLFRIKESVLSRKQSFQFEVINSQTQKSLSRYLTRDNQKTQGDDNFYIKSVIDVMVSRHNLEPSKRRKNKER